MRFPCALAWLAEMSGHSHIYSSLFPALPNRLDMFPDVQKNSMLCCSKAQWVRPERLSELLTLAPFIHIDSHLVFTGCKNYFKLSYTDPTEVKFPYFTFPLETLLSAILEESQLKTNVNARYCWVGNIFQRIINHIFIPHAHSLQKLGIQSLQAPNYPYKLIQSILFGGSLDLDYCSQPNYRNKWGP